MNRMDGWMLVKPGGGQQAGDKCGKGFSTPVPYIPSRPRRGAAQPGWRGRRGRPLSWPAIDRGVILRGGAGSSSDRD